MKNPQKPKPQQKAEQVVEAFVDRSSFHVDPLGSYTGKTINRKERPVQDVDDL